MSCRVAVVGHVEWVRFLVVERGVAPGAILHATDAWDESAGGGGVAAVELARLAGACTLWTAVGSDPAGQRIAAVLAPHGVHVVGATRPEPHRQGVTVIDPDGERTIVVVGPAQAPRGADGAPPELTTMDAVYVCKADPAAVRAARQARIVVATARELAVLQAANVPVDALVCSANDPDEAYVPGALTPTPAVFFTNGAQGGRYRLPDGTEGQWDAAPLPGPVRDAYGAGDCFAAGLTYALGCGLPVDEAVALAAARGAAAVARRGVLG